MEKKIKGLTLIELMVAIAIIAIVSMAASLAFKGNSQRMYVREALNVLASVRLEVQSKYASTGKLPRTVQGLNNTNTVSMDNGDIIEQRRYYNVPAAGGSPAYGVFVVGLTRKVLDVVDPFDRTLSLGWVESGRGDLIFLCGNYNANIIFDGEHPEHCKEPNVQDALLNQ